MQKGDLVRFIDEKQHEKFGVFSIIDIKGDIAICGYTDYNRIGMVKPWNCKLTELMKET